MYLERDGYFHPIASDHTIALSKLPEIKQNNSKIKILPIPVTGMMNSLLTKENEKAKTLDEISSLKKKILEKEKSVVVYDKHISDYENAIESLIGTK